MLPVEINCHVIMQSNLHSFHKSTALQKTMQKIIAGGESILQKVLTDHFWGKGKNLLSHGMRMKRLEISSFLVVFLWMRNEND